MMREVYELLHRYVVEEVDGEAVQETKLLGFFSSKQKCQEAISYYITQEGFEKYPDNFVIDKIEADIDDYHDIPGDFEGKVYFLSHEWYNGEYDYVTYVGYCSTRQKAEDSKMLVQLEEEFSEHQNGFWIDEYIIDQMEWKEGFCSWEDMEYTEIL